MRNICKYLWTDAVLMHLHSYTLHILLPYYWVIHVNKYVYIVTQSFHYLEAIMNTKKFVHQSFSKTYNEFIH